MAIVLQAIGQLKFVFFNSDPESDLLVQNLLRYAYKARKEGLLSLDEKACDTLPEWRNDRRSAITIEELLSHTSGLDPDLAILLIEHDMDVVFDVADEISVLHFGQVLETGTPAQIHGSKKVQEIYLGSG